MMNGEKLLVLNAFAKVYARGENPIERAQYDFDVTADQLMSALEIAGCDTSRIAIAMNIIDSWHLFFKTARTSSEVVVHNAYCTMETLIKSTPTEYLSCNLNSQKALKLGFKYSETADAYAIPIWYWPIVFGDEGLYDENGNFVGVKDDIANPISTGLYYPYYIKF